MNLISPHLCVMENTKSTRWLFLILIMFTTVYRSVAQRQEGYKIISSELIFKTAAFQQCHASTIAENARGQLICAWFGGSHEGATDVCIWASILEKGQWSHPFRLVCGLNADGSSTPCWNPVLFNVDGESIHLYYKQGPSPRQWKGMKITSPDGGETWSEPQTLDDGLTGPVKNKPLVTKAGTWLYPASKESDSRWQVFIERSTNQGMSFDQIPIDTANPVKVIQPALITDPSGHIHALCRSDQDRIMESLSTDDGLTWSPLINTMLPNPNAGIDAITLPSGTMMLVYNPTERGKDWWNGRNRLSVAVSADGTDWKEIMKLEDQAEGEFSYPAIISDRDGRIHITYTYNRKYIKHVSLRIR